MQYAISTNGLTHTFSDGSIVVNNIELRVPEGSIYGFLGPNGAGKTTTMRLITGLLSKQKGDINVLGKSLNTSRVEVMRSVGTMIESPSMYTHLTAKENLKALQLIYQCNPKRIEEVLHITGLENTGKKTTGKFSLGMKQRLGIAMALLHEPQLLILDEPTNGLDPNGMIEIRELLRSLHAQQGLTIFVSSHLLSEVEKLATHTGIIHQGKLQFQGSMDELRSAQQSELTTSIRTDDNQRAKEIINAQQRTAQESEGKLMLSNLSTSDVIAINKILVENGIGVIEISNHKHDLESIFMNLIK